MMTAWTILATRAARLCLKQGHNDRLDYTRYRSCPAEISNNDMIKKKKITADPKGEIMRG